MIDADKFRQIAGHWLSGVAVVTAMNGEGSAVGMTMSAVASLSLDPPQFLVCIDLRAKTLAAIQSSGHFCINYLSEGQEAVSAEFARRGGDRFVGVSFHTGQTGAPILEGSIAWVECRLNSILPGGDHAIVIGDVVHGDAPGGRPLGYFQGAYRKIG